jgi:hypothetical protein
MRKYIHFVAMCGLLIGGAAIASAQAQPAKDATQKAGQATQKAGQTAERAVTDHDATYGRVKEFKAGDKLVLDINNAPDKSYDLTKEHDVVVAPGLKVGDPVKITETDVNGKKTTNIAMDNTPGVEHGDPKK